MTISRISSLERSRYTVRNPPGTATEDGWQHSHTRSSMTDSFPSLPSGLTFVDISDTLSDPFSRLRLSSQRTATPSFAGARETKPCSTHASSRCGVTGELHVAPLSRDVATATL